MRDGKGRFSGYAHNLVNSVRLRNPQPFNMRKRLKDKKRSCAMCKPHKKKWANRWKIKDLDTIHRSETEIGNSIMK